MTSKLEGVGGVDSSAVISGRFSSGLALLYLLFIVFLFVLWIFQKVTMTVLGKIFSVILSIYESILKNCIKGGTKKVGTGSEK